MHATCGDDVTFCKLLEFAQVHYISFRDVYENVHNTQSGKERGEEAEEGESERCLGVPYSPALTSWFFVLQCRVSIERRVYRTKMR